MNNQLPKPATDRDAAGPRAWGYRSRYFPQGHAAIEIPVYRVMIWGCLMYQGPVGCYSVGLN